MTTRINPRQSRPEPPADGSRTDARLGQLVRLLVDNAMLVVSGTKIADELQTNRSEVWRLIEQLRELGVEITGHSATGYQLLSVPDLLLPDVIAPLVHGTVFASDIRHYFRIGSTNIEAMQAAAAGAPDGSVFLAEEQTAGRGRGGHTWESAPSTGIYCSAILRPALSPADVLVISLAAGLAVADAVENVTGLKPDLRWPNDLLIGDRKVCGILTELNAEVTRVRYVVVGIGMNVNQHAFPADLEKLATSLSLETGRTHSRVELTAALLKSLDREYRALRTNVSSARADILRRFELHSSYVRGKQVWVEEDGGYDGTTVGLDDRGFLLVQTANGMRTVLSGGVRPRQA
jgi:BirA family transcriptional regulator, biotin operon repressor / biotin---[acetyl-CoA-carboxylase] ligase